jgi:hypothetical protein
MRFSGRRVLVGNKLVTKLTCATTYNAHQLISSGVSGILILHKRHQENPKFTKVVGLSSDARICTRCTSVMLKTKFIIYFINLYISLDDK